jgi:predicted nucleic acid-binding protein
MIVVDTNVIGYLFLESPRSEQVERVFEIDPIWVAPRLWRSEFRNVLAKYLQAGYLGLTEAITIMDRAEELLSNGDYDVPSAPVLALSHASSCTAYDCEFAVLARDLGLQFVTVDRQILVHFPDIAISPQAYLESHPASDN